jgi:flagellar FliJ protein
MQSLDTLLQRETLLRDQAQMLLRQAEDAAQRAERQAGQLREYRDQYQARWASEFGRGSTMQIMLCYRSFMQRLDQAVQQQAQHSEQAQHKVVHVRQLLLQRERQLASVLKMIERQCAEQQRAGRRHEQKQIDELAQRMHQRRSGDGHALPWP